MFSSDDYKHTSDTCTGDYISISEIIKEIEWKKECTFKIARSKLGDALKLYTSKAAAFPPIKVHHVKHRNNVTEYKLKYGEIPHVYMVDIKSMAMQLHTARSTETYDIIEGELEVMALAYWRLETQDLKEYKEQYTRPYKKEMLLYLTHKLFEELDTHTCAPDKKENYRIKINTLKKYAKFNNLNQVTTASLYVLKTIISDLADFISTKFLEYWSGFFSDFNIHKLIFGHTFNFLMKNRKSI